MPLCERCRTITDTETLRNVGGSCPTCGLDLSRHLVEGGAVRPHHELQQAHDLLVSILLGQIPIPFDPDSMTAINVAAGVICWTMYHDHNPAFANNLAKIRAILDDMGIVAAPLPRTMTSDEMVKEGYAPEATPPPGAFPDEDSPQPTFESEEDARRFVELVDDLREGDWEITCKSCGRVSTSSALGRNDFICPGCHTAVCVYCGCTEMAACEDGCSWIAYGICSSHPEKVEVVQ